MILKVIEMTKQRKRENKIDKEAKKNDDIVVGILILTFCGFLIASVLTTTTSTPTKTLYITANHFPIKVPDIQLGDTENASVYIFYGTSQPNGTECISSAEIYTYQFNYTTQSLSSIPEITNVTNPKEVADMYYNSLFGNSLFATNRIIHIPDGYTLLCPDIVNATR